ncbi:MAG: thioredoxin [Clostridia bacterium]|jgi:thioredoxin 1|nr:thioredoxin [Clostridia bacterium]
MAVITGTADNFDTEVLQSDIPVLVDFNADWCGPCQILKPTIEEIAEENKSVKIVSVNIDDEEDLSDEYDVFSIPCLVLFRNGEEAGRSVGLKNKDEILDLIGGN